MMFDPLSFAALAAMAPPPAAMVWMLPAVATQDEAAKALQDVEAVVAKYQAEEEEFSKKYRAATTDEEREKLFAGGTPNPSKYFAELQTLAEKHRKTEAAARAASWVISMAGRGGGADESAWALEMMLTDFIDTDHIASVPQMCSSLNTRNIGILERIRTESDNERAQALAAYFRGNQLLTSGKAARELAEPGSTGDQYLQYEIDSIDDELKETLKTSDPDKLTKSGESLLEECMKKYADVEIYPGRGMKVGPKAEGALFEARNLQIGDMSPDIEGVDAEGITFKLSDYRGQVVVLDFWGFW